jgi:hypothetical protein
MEPATLIVAVIVLCAAWALVAWKRIRRAHQVLVQTDEQEQIVAVDRQRTYVRRIEELAKTYAPSDKVAALNTLKLGRDRFAVPA